MQTLSVQLSTETAEKLQGHLAKGQYENESHVVNEALRQMDDREYDRTLQTLREALAEGVRQAHEGDCVEFSMQEILDELDAEQ